MPIPRLRPRPRVPAMPGHMWVICKDCEGYGTEGSGRRGRMRKCGRCDGVGWGERMKTERDTLVEEMLTEVFKKKEGDA